MNEEVVAGEKEAPFAHLSRGRVRSLLNCLTEATFFYRTDDPDLFDYLRRHRGEFERFFDESFGWALHVDRKCARLIKRVTHNGALSPKQRDLFDLTRREECILFMLLLEFHELELSAQNAHYEHDEDVRFVLSDFLAHARTRFRERLGEAAPGDRELLDHVRRLFEELTRHRFVRLCERGDEEGAPELLLYEALPGMHCYDPGALTTELFVRAYGVAVAGEGEAMAGEGEEESMTGEGEAMAGEGEALAGAAGDDDGSAA